MQKCQYSRGVTSTPGLLYLGRSDLIRSPVRAPRRTPMQHPPRSAPATPHTLGPSLALAVIVGAAALAGCSRPLLSPKDERSQYDRYDRARSQYAQQFKEDEYGRRTPNLRGRLSQKE